MEGWTGWMDGRCLWSWRNEHISSILMCSPVRDGQIQDNYKMYYWSLSIYLFSLLVFFSFRHWSYLPRQHTLYQQTEWPEACFVQCTCSLCQTQSKNRLLSGRCHPHIFCKLPLLSPGLTCLSNYKGCLRRAYKWRGLYPSGNRKSTSKQAIAVYEDK